MIDEVVTDIVDKVIHCRILRAPPDWKKVDIYIAQSGKLLAAGLIFLISFFKFPAKVHMRWQGEWYRLTLIVVQWALKGMGGGEDEVIASFILEPG